MGCRAVLYYACVSAPRIGAALGMTTRDIWKGQTGANSWLVSTVSYYVRTYHSNSLASDGLIDDRMKESGESGGSYSKYPLGDNSAQVWQCAWIS